MRLKLKCLTLVVILLLPIVGIPAISIANQIPADIPEPPYSTAVTLNSTSSFLKSSQTETLDIRFERITITAYTFLIYEEEYIQFEVTSFKSVDVEGREYPVYKLITEPYPIRKVVEVEQSILESTLPENPMPKYVWDGLTFVKAPGNATHYVKYDHPDNYDTYRPLQINIDYNLAGTSRVVSHIAKYHIEDAISKNDLGAIVAGILSLLVVLVTNPEPLISKATAGLLAVIVAILALMDRSVNWFLTNIVQTELGDGWVYMWDYGSWWIFHWFWFSVGALRDWGWLFVFIDPGVSDYIPGDVNGDGRVDSVDLGMVYNELGSWHPACDLNFDGKVNYADLGLEFGYYLGWQTRHYTYAPPIETTATTFGQTINIIARKYP